jgi:NAD(P)H-nitrite reductase large subunit
MESVCTPERCEECTDRLVCHCLQISEPTLLDAVNRLGLRTLADVQACTGAGEGCTACHKRLQQYLNRTV